MITRLQFFFNYLTRDPVGFILYLIALLMALVFHECAHGFVALKCGDPTAKWYGRLTLNPLKHLDPIGMACMLLLGVGWAQPVPVNPRNFRHYKRDSILVSIAGIAANFILFLISLSSAILLLRSHSNSIITDYLFTFFKTFAEFNIGLAVFNLLPVPPLDGYRILNQTVFHGRLSLNANTEQYIRLGFLFLCMTGMLNGLLSAVDGAIWNFFSNLLLQILI